MAFELTVEFITDTLAAYEFELSQIREVLANTAAKRHVNEENLKRRQARLLQMKAQLQEHRREVSDRSEIIHDVRTGYGDRRPGSVGVFS